MKMRPTYRLWAMALASTLMFSACAGTVGADKTGTDTVVLHLGTIDSVNPNGMYFGSQTFVDALEEVSGGRLKVEVMTNYGEGDPDAESKLVAAIAAGDLDGGAPSTRAFSRAGISGLEVVEAPMVITSYAAQKALVTGPIAQELLSRLEGSGLVGLGLAVGPLRRPFAAQAPLLDPDDWNKARMRVFNSPIQAETIRLLGAEPVDLSFGWIDEVKAGNLRGAEFDIAQYWTNGYTTQAGNVTANVVLWPKVIVLSLSQQRWDSLSEEQKAWVQTAADEAVQVSAEASYDESTPAQKLCEEGVRFLVASPEQVAALQHRVAPLIEQLSNDPATGALLADMQALAAQHPGPDVPDVPEECRQVLGETDPNVLAVVPEEPATLPDGLYRVDISLADVESAGLGNAPGWTGTWTLEIIDGTYALRCQPIDQPGRDCGNVSFDENFTFDTVLDAGFVRGSGNSIFFVYDAGLHSSLTGCELPCFPQPTAELTWSLDGDSLTLTNVDGGTPERWLNPWTKIG